MGASTGGTGSGTPNGSGSFVSLGNSVPVEPWSEHANAPKGRAAPTPATSPSLKNSPRDISTRRSPFPVRDHGGPPAPGQKKPDQ